MYRFIMMLTFMFVCSFTMSANDGSAFDDQSIEIVVDIDQGNLIDIPTMLFVPTPFPIISKAMKHDESFITVGVDKTLIVDIDPRGPQESGQAMTQNKPTIIPMCRSSDLS